MNHEAHEKLLKTLKHLENEGEADKCDQQITYSLTLCDNVTNCGGAWVTPCEETGGAEITAQLGPVNTLKVIEFLRFLPEEP